MCKPSTAKMGCVKSNQLCIFNQQRLQFYYDNS